MSQNESLTITFTGSSPDSPDSGDDWLRLEQPEWPTKQYSSFYEWAEANGHTLKLTNYARLLDQYQSHCEDDGSLDVEIYVHKSRADLEYRLTATQGTFGDRMLEEEERIKSDIVSLQDYYDFGEEIVSSLVSVEWEESGVYDQYGEPVYGSIPYTLDGNIIRFEQTLFGSLRLTYRTGFDKYFLTVTPRDEYDEQRPDSAYESTVMAFYSGKVETLDVDLPEITNGCGGGGSIVQINPTDPDDDGNCYDLYVKYHKCTGEKISEEKVQVPCPES